MANERELVDKRREILDGVRIRGVRDLIGGDHPIELRSETAADGVDIVPGEKPVQSTPDRAGRWKRLRPICPNRSSRAAPATVSSASGQRTPPRRGREGVRIWPVVGVAMPKVNR